MADPTNVFAMDDIKFMTGLNVEPVIASETSIQIAVGKYYSGSNEIDIFDAAFAVEAESIGDGNGKNGQNRQERSRQQRLRRHRAERLQTPISMFRSTVSILTVTKARISSSSRTTTRSISPHLARASEDAPVVRLVNVLMVDSLRRGASDIHVEPYEKDFRIRFRIDGVLYDVMHPPMKIRDPLISRLKIMAKLDISEKRLPQDGRIKIKVKIDNRSRELDFRVSTLPTLFGEKVVLRLLDKDKLMLDMTKLGFEAGEPRKVQAEYRQSVRNGARNRPDRFG